MIKRINFNILGEPLNTTSLLNDQLTPYKFFLLKKKHKGVESVFKDIFPIKSSDGKFRLEYFKYRLDLPDYSSFDCIYRGTTYLTSIYIYIKFFKNDVLEQSGEVYLGNIPLMTKKGSFVINGSERVVISQLNRSPGVFFSFSTGLSGVKTHYLKIIPDKGVWIEIQIDSKGIIYANLDKKKKNRVLVTTLLKVLGKTNTNSILKNYYTVKVLDTCDFKEYSQERTFYLLDNVVDFNYNIIAKKYTLVNIEVVKLLKSRGVSFINCIDVSKDSGVFLKTVRQDFLSGYEESLISFYKKIKPLENINSDAAKLFVHKLFRDFKNYDLGLVGRHRLNSKLNTKTPYQFRNLSVHDVFSSIKYLVFLFLNKDGYVEDDIDDLSLKKIRTCGDLICSSFKTGLLKAEKILKEKLLFYNVNIEFLNLQKLIYSKNITLTVRDFFNRSQLSQFMDQINPLAEITHKRRVTSLGPGGLSKDRAGFDVRDVHSSHYGKICPIETPEGPNIGLINSLSLYTCINSLGFLETPYQELKGGVKTGKIVNLDSFKEKSFYIGQSNCLGGEGNVIVRRGSSFFEIKKELIDFVDLSPKQIISTATALIPFIEHNDANRALMGSNMQRQSVPLLINEKPYVGSGLELKISEDSSNTVYSKYDCRVIYADSTKALTFDYLNREVQLYRFLKFFRTNSSTCFNHKLMVKEGEFISQNNYLVDGPSVNTGELSLGRNVLVAFMPWYGYNFEDAIIISDSLLKHNTYTSIHINEFETVVQETKLGSEEITKEIPNLSRDSLKNLDGSGIIKVGSWVKPGDILVGKITPQGETNLAPEEKLIKAVFGEKSFNVKNSSMVLPPGTFGFIMNVQYFISNSVSDNFELRPFEQVNSSRGVVKEVSCSLQENLIKTLSNILLGEKLPLRVFNKSTDETIIPSNKKITKTLLRKLSVNYKVIDINPSPIRIKIMSIVDNHKKSLKNLDLSNLKNKKKGGGTDVGGVSSRKIKSVKIFVAIKKNIQVGDKMSGRHGNKGVVSKIIPESDMPFLDNGNSIQMVLNPLGVPSRMNVGQVLETHTGLVCRTLGVWVSTPPFNGICERRVQEYLYKSKNSVLGKVQLRDGYTGTLFDNKVVVGYMYIMKLNHLVSSKIHSRAVGPYSLITQQPLGGKSQYGGQRFGEMEVWALEAYGSAYTLQELLTVKSDDVQGRATIYESIVKGSNKLQAGMPQSFNVLMKELQGLCLDIKLNKY